MIEDPVQTPSSETPPTKPGRDGSPLLSLMERFNRGIHLLLGIALVIASLMIAALFVVDVIGAFTHKTLISGFLHAVGSLLILWTFSELLHSEIRHLKGGKIELAVFIEVAIAATIRHMLVAGTEPFDFQASLMTLGQILTLGIVYWLMSTRPMGGKAA